MESGPPHSPSQLPVAPQTSPRQPASPLAVWKCVCVGGEDVSV